MSDILAQFGLVAEGLLDQTGEANLPAIVPGRVAHIDADFTAYMIAADTVAEVSGDKRMRDFEYKCGQVEDIARSIARQAGATSYVMHLTPPASTKGGRFEQAVQAAYQGNRVDKEAPADLHRLRGYIGTTMPSMVHLDQEADDGLAQANWADPNNSVICSKDKDLLMVPGLHLNMTTFELFDVPFDSFGTLHPKLKEDSEGKMVNDGVTGTGPAFFFYQCLAGDTADNVKGIPKIAVEDWIGIQPTQKYLKAVESGKQEKIDKELAACKAKLCGPQMALKLLGNVTSVKQAFQTVKELYVNIGKEHEFKHWRTGERVTPTQALLGDMLCLWMRRNKNPNDAVAYIKEHMA